MVRQTNIIINIQVEGLHSWPECSIKEVSFLKEPHRHIFFICCKKKVEHNDRDVEIIRFKREVQYFLLSEFGKGHKNAEGCDFGRMSCEDISLLLLEKFNLNYCSVLEDNENGAETYLKK